ncbi:MAG: class I SAM-dependent methyltransferase [Planctomycetota bacterium]
MNSIESPPSQPVSIDLEGVPETMLWPLWNRAIESPRSDALIRDPWAVELVERLDYDFAAHFDKPSVFHPIRSRVADDLIRAHHARYGSEAIVVALGEGLDAQRLRTEVPAEQWVSVDLPESIETRRKLVPGAESERLIPRSALDTAWMEAVPRPGPPPLVTALGLLMYFEEEDVRGLLRSIGESFPGAEIFFDTIPPLFSRKTLRGLKITESYQAPPMPWGVPVTAVAGFLASAGLSPVKVQTYAEPFPSRLRLYWLLGHLRPIRATLAGGLVHARAAAAG